MPLRLYCTQIGGRHFQSHLCYQRKGISRKHQAVRLSGGTCAVLTLASLPVALFWPCRRQSPNFPLLPKHNQNGTRASCLLRCHSRAERPATLRLMLYPSTAPVSHQTDFLGSHRCPIPKLLPDSSPIGLAGLVAKPDLKSVGTAGEFISVLVDLLLFGAHNLLPD
jgi:hypothetical protein